MYQHFKLFNLHTERNYFSPLASSVLMFWHAQYNFDIFQRRYPQVTLKMNDYIDIRGAQSNNFYTVLIPTTRPKKHISKRVSCHYFARIMVVNNMIYSP